MNEASIIAVMSLFAIGAVAIILYQHAQATQQVLAAASGQAAPNDQATLLGIPASLAGTPTVGQAGTSQVPSIAPLNINPGYTIQ